MMLSLTLSGCGAFGILPDGQISRTFDFRDGLQGWEAEVADYPVEQVSNLQLQAALRDLPDELGVEGSGFRVQSFNTPDDLFTFIKRRLTVIDGIRAGETYIVHYSVLLASNAPSGCAGVGGAPGESVYVKVGASPIEPAPRLSQDGLEMVPNVDVGDQATGGAAASVAGTLANGVPCDLIPDLESAPYVLILREREHTNVVTASDGGVLWLLVGTDSGFESLTALYYLRIDVTLTLLSNGTDSTDDSPAG
jgi:hypothetical protein